MGAYLNCFLNIMKSKNRDFIMPDLPAYRLHLAFAVGTFSPHGYAYIRPLALHKEPFVVKSKETIFFQLSLKQVKNGSLAFCRVRLLGKFCSACLCGSVALRLCNRTMSAYSLPSTSSSLACRKKEEPETVVFCVNDFFFLHINLYWLFIL